MLTSLTYNGNSITYAYNENGIRIGKTVDFYYLYNAQGDVTNILNEDMYVVVAYQYDSWGKLLSCEGNADSQLNDDILGNNLYLYCSNNPINRIDVSGRGWWIIACIAVSGVAGLATRIYTNISLNETWYNGYAGSFVGGCVYGGVIGKTGSVIGAGYSSAASEIVFNESLSYTPLAKFTGVENKDFTKENIISSVANIIVETAINGTASALTGFVAGKLIPTNSGWFKTQKFSSSFIGKYAVKSELQTLVQSGLLYAYEKGKNFFGKMQEAVVNFLP